MEYKIRVGWPIYQLVSCCVEDYWFLELKEKTGQG